MNHRQGCNNALPGQPPVLPKALPQNKRDDTGSGAAILPVTSPSKEVKKTNFFVCSNLSIFFYKKKYLDKSIEAILNIFHIF